jgi:phage baseplate assembly protein W
MTIDFRTAGAMTDTERDSITNSISTIAETPYGSAPYMRGMGVRSYPPESESETALNRYATEVITQCGIWEDRAAVSEISYKDNEMRMVISSE